MPIFEHVSDFDIPAQQVWDFHARPGAFARLAPTWQNLRVVEAIGPFESMRLTFRIQPGPIGVTWVAQHEGYEPGRHFQDRMVRGPFARWLHTHRVIDLGSGRSRLHDHIDYALPMGPIGALGRGLFEADLRRMFTIRHNRTLEDCTRHAALASAGPLRIAITGSTGLIGENLCAYLLNAGHTVYRLARPGSTAGSPDLPTPVIRWDPDTGTIDAAELEGIDAVVHLAGRNIGAARWTQAFKQEVMQSRVRSTSLLAKTLASLKNPPRVLISASGVSGYRDNGDTPVDESSPLDASFLAEVTRAWEGATADAQRAGVRVVLLRIGAVLTPRGGLLARLRPIFNAGLGGRIGPGTQRLAALGMDDMLAIIEHAIHTPTLRGPVNAVAPECPTNADFTRTLARVLRRPAVLPAPASIIRALFGEMSSVALKNNYVRPLALERSGYRFVHPTIEAALRTQLGRPNL
ncbi:MAG: TIGR01777 family oxidoreductase [Phycisphaerales bacterium]